MRVTPELRARVEGLLAGGMPDEGFVRLVLDLLGADTSRWRLCPCGTAFVAGASANAEQRFCSKGCAWRYRRHLCADCIAAFDASPVEATTWRRTHVWHLRGADGLELCRQEP
ncbi:MAG: hypothetical protein KatS3mg014_2449 [Actinomycetota bacterium]|nr:MAG: hypothetical protein KatS3mg014_2449 [Actinomycetota bacterium]